jgi:VWFA-related protein
MLNRLLVLIVLAGSLGLASPSARALTGDEPQTFRSTVDLVTIQASVRDQRGRVVSGLTTRDFEVRDNGLLRPILSLRSDRESPLSLAILVDMSGSMRVGPKIAMARQAYEAILAQLRQGQDEVGLFSFDAMLHERHGFTNDIASLKDGLAEFEPFGSTSIYDATGDAARRLAARPSTHKALIVLTDGTDTSSMLTGAEVSGLAASINVPVFVVVTVPSMSQRLELEGAWKSATSDVADLRELAAWSGGELLYASTFTETVATASTLIDGIREQYVLAIEAASAREWRRLDVRVLRRSATVKARSGYYAG